MHRHHAWNCLIIYFHDNQWQWERSWPRGCNQRIMCRCPEPGSPVQDTYWPPPGLVTLLHDATLKCLSIILEKRHEKNINKNPITEKVVEELGLELYNVKTDNGPVSRLTLALAAANVNHEPSARSKTPKFLLPDTPPVQVGDLVYLIHEKDKTRTGDKYMIAPISDHSCHDQFRSKLYEVPITHCIPLSGRQNHPSDDHGASSDK